MGEGFDLIGRKNMMRENREKRTKGIWSRQEKITSTTQQEAKMDDTTHVISNIVFANTLPIFFARDPKIFDTKTGCVNQRQAFVHENLLDIK